ncbi:hypothetical protein [Bradyrhizobium jicamae]|uniref:hypothetical protein n=1 Tax=Bradyrhizobium jicamae TaxID=280332 RepID=UPI001BA6EDCA|nr:hypothetical protein [Bradyrhizobium jicamae]MBR0939421.1 hypothetical protein [Bradyrhizobium jicamae]
MLTEGVRPLLFALAWKANLSCTSMLVSLTIEHWIAAQRHQRIVLQVSNHPRGIDQRFIDRSLLSCPMRTRG